MVTELSVLRLILRNLSISDSDMDPRIVDSRLILFNWRSLILSKSRFGIVLIAWSM